jgi:hypothetical protein
MTIGDKIKKIAIGVAVYAALASLPIDHKTEIKPGPANEQSITRLAPENFNADQKMIQEPAKVSQVKQEEEIQPTPEAIERMDSIKKASFFPLYYPIGNLGYAEREYNISMDWIMSRKTKQGDSLEKYLRMEGVSPAEIRLYQRVFLTINNPSYYPKGYNKRFEITEGDLVLRIGKIANYEDKNRDGKVLGEPGTYLSADEVQKITDLKNNYGELLNGTIR